MGICLCHVEAIIRVQSFFTDYVSVVKKGDRKKTYPVIDSRIPGKHDGVSCNSVLHCVSKLQPFL